MKQTALILIDIQNDYFDGGLMALPNMQAAASNAATALAEVRARNGLVIHIQHIAASDTAPFFRPDTEGCEINTAVQPRGDEKVIQKARPNSFIGTDLEQTLRDAGLETVTICGAMSQMCVDATTRAAVDLGFKVTVLEDACAAADVTFGGTAVAANLVHAAIMAPLAASYAQVVSTESWTRR